LDRTGEADKAIFRIAGAGQAVSPRTILHEVEGQTDYGRKFIRNWLNLAMDHILEASLDPVGAGHH